MISEEMRVGGTIGSPVTGGSFLALMFAPTLAILAIPVRSSYKFLASFALVVGGMGLLFTQTRGSWIAVAVSVGLFLLLAWRRGWISWKLPFALALLGALSVVVLQDRIATRFAGGEDGSSAKSRLPLIQMAAAMISDSPVWGVGVNNCAVAAAQYSMRPEFRSEWFYTIHNKYLLEWVETGIFGLAAFLLFLMTTLYQGWGVWRWRDRLLSPIALALMLAIAGQMIHMLVDVFNSRPQVQSLWLCAAMIAAMSRMQGEE
jgi:putative inorganic carbon (HCO3(-)) transporter